MDKRGVVSAIISAAAFGLITLFIIPIVKSETLNSVSILLYRLLFATVGIGIAALIKKESFRLKFRDIPKIGFLGLFYSSCALFLLLAYTISPNGSAILTTLHYLYPVIVMIVMVFAFKERFSIRLAIAALIAISGVAIMTMSGSETSTNVSFLGIVYVLFSVIAYAVYIVGNNKIGVGHIPHTILTFYILLAGVITITLYGLLTDEILPLNNIDALINLLLLAIICTVLSNLTLLYAIKKVGSTTTSILGSVEPLVAIFVGVFIFNEEISLFAYFGAIMIIASVMVVVAKR